MVTTLLETDKSQGRWRVGYQEPPQSERSDNASIITEFASKYDIKNVNYVCTRFTYCYS